MAANDYQFFTCWRLLATVEEVSEVLGDAESLPRWWPSVYLEARLLEPGNADGVGKVVELYTKGFLPYTLRWRFRTTETRHPYGFGLEAWGDFVGIGVWRFIPVGDLVEVTYSWRVRAQKPLLRRLSWLLRPIFAANHRWAMARGEESLRLELARRRAATGSATGGALDLPAPPGPTPSAPLPWLAYVLRAHVLRRRRSQPQVPPRPDVRSQAQQ